MDPLPEGGSFCYNAHGKERKKGEKSVARRILAYFKKDVVFTVSLILAAGSCVLVPPGPVYASYLDWHTLIMLFCLMVIVEGIRQTGAFLTLGQGLLHRVKSPRGVAAVLVFLCFFASMLVTNDVSLLTFVPFGMGILEMTGLRRQLPLTVVLMTIAANLGSMFTPIGNPQNIYLFSLSGMSVGSFFILMLPYTLLAAVLLAASLWLGVPKGMLPVASQGKALLSARELLPYGVLFACAIATVSGALPDGVLLGIVVVVLLWKKKELLLQADFGLLLTFVFFFIFTGNLNALPQLRAMMEQALAGRETLVGILLSQVISNVPAAMLLSNYTNQISALIVGTNLGGLGTLIASMASLISYKQVAVQYPKEKKKYFCLFTTYNIGFLLLLYGLYILLS